MCKYKSIRGLSWRMYKQDILVKKRLKMVISMGRYYTIYNNDFGYNKMPDNGIKWYNLLGGYDEFTSRNETPLIKYRDYEGGVIYYNRTRDREKIKIDIDNEIEEFYRELGK